MSSNSFGDNFRITSFGESHGPALGVVIDGLRPGVPVDVAAIQHDLDRRRPGVSAASSPRREADRVEVLAGVFEGRTTGAPIALLVRNRDARPEDYAPEREIFRPGHADFTWWRKFGIRDWRGGGRSSGRETVARVAAGALARQILGEQGVRIVGQVLRVGNIDGQRFDPAAIERNPVHCADPMAARRMLRAIESARRRGDSLGGVVEVVARGVPPGWGDPVFQKLDAQIAAAMMSIGAVKGVELGDGFALSRLRGSQSNDPLGPSGPLTNRMGGVLGGITTGQPVVVRLAVKPTPSIARAQRTVDTAGRPRRIELRGRHDPCICPRLVPVAEAMLALVLCDAFLRQQAICAAASSEAELRAELDFCDAELLRAVHRRAAVQAALATGGAGAKRRGGGAAGERRRSPRRSLCAQLGLPAGAARALFAAADAASAEIAPAATDATALVAVHGIFAPATTARRVGRDRGAGVTRPKGASGPQPRPEGTDLRPRPGSSRTGVRCGPGLRARSRSRPPDEPTGRRRERVPALGPLDIAAGTGRSASPRGRP